MLLSAMSPSSQNVFLSHLTKRRKSLDNKLEHSKHRSGDTLSHLTSGERLLSELVSDKMAENKCCMPNVA